MTEVANAQTMVNYYTERPPQLRGRVIYVQFSNYDQLKSDPIYQVRIIETSGGYFFYPSALWKFVIQFKSI